MNTPYSAKAQNPAFKEFLSLDMSGAEDLPYFSDDLKRRLFMLFFFVFMLLFPCFNSGFNVARATDLNLDKTYLPPSGIRGPPGTKLNLTLTNEDLVLYRNGVFDENGILLIRDMFNPDSTTSINTNNRIIPSNKHYIDVHNTNLIFSPAYKSNSKSQERVLGVGVYNSNGQLIDRVNFNQGNGFITANWDGVGKANGQYFFGVETESGVVYKQFTFLKQPNTAVIPDAYFKNVEKHNNENSDGNSLENIVNGKSKAMWTVDFKYTCDEDGPGVYHHEDSFFTENINDALTWFTPTHYLTPLRQFKHADFNVVDGYTGEGLSDAGVRLLDGEREFISYLSCDENGKFSILNLPTDSLFFLEVMHPNFRNVEYDFFVSKREAKNDTIASNPYYGITTVPDKEHYIALFLEPENYFARMDGEMVNNPELTMARVLEGKMFGGEVNYDGQVFRDLVMDTLIPCWNLNSWQETYLHDAARILFGKEGFDDMFVKADTSRFISSPDYNYIDGDENAGINWGTDGNNTNHWPKWMYNHNGKMFSHIVMGGETNSGGRLSTFHELMWYLNQGVIYTEESPGNTSGGNYSINDPLSIQYVTDVEKAKYNYGWSTIETSDLLKTVEDFDVKNPVNVLDLKTAR